MGARDRPLTQGGDRRVVKEGSHASSPVIGIDVETEDLRSRLPVDA